MVQRRESVKIDLTGDLIPKLGEAAAAASLLSRRLRAMERASSGVSANFDAMAASARSFNDEMDRTNASAGRFQSQSRNMQSSSRGIVTSLAGADRGARQTGDSINQLTGRLSLLADGLLVLGPGLVPVAAAGAAALGGMATAATALAVAGGSAIVAFQGIGDAVGAVQDYQLNPTVAGLEKAREAMAQLGPDAQRFVMEFQKVRPTLTDIKRSAEAGWFPGLTEAIGKLEQLAPQVEEIFFNAGEAGGFALDSAAESLISDRWAPFLDVLAEEVPSAVGSISRIIGDVAHGLSEMLRVFAGDSGFLDWLESVADGFDRWASSADAASGIEEIMMYVRQNGPELQKLVVSLTEATAAIVAAAAPLGGPVLIGLTAVSEAVRVIAESDMATPLLAAVAALRVFNRMQAATVALSGRFAAATAAPTVATTGAGSAQSRAAAAAAAQRAGLPAGVVAGAGAPRASDVRRQQAAAAAQRRQMVGLGAAGALSIGLLGSGAASDIGLTNAAMLTLAGTMAGPVGAALGALAGLSLDAAAGNNELTDSIEAAGQALNSGDIAAGMTALAEAQRQQADLVRIANLGNFEMASPSDALASLKNDVEGLFGKSDVEEGAEALAKLNEQARNTQEAVAALGEATGMSVGPLDDSVRSYQELQAVLEANESAMIQLGITQQDLARAKSQQDAIANDKTGDNSLVRNFGSATPLDDLNNAIADQARYMDSAQGKADGYTAALGRLVAETGTAEERARGLGEALDALLDPNLDAEAALDSLRQQLKVIRELDSGAGFSGANEASRDNRAATRDYAEAVKQRLVTMVNAKRSEEEVARAVKASREQFIQSGIAAGFSAEQMRRRANAIGLTPKLVETTFRGLGLSKFDVAVNSLKKQLKELPRDVKTAMRTEGVPKSRAEAKALANQFDLTAKQRKALFTLVDQASGKAAAINAALNNAARNRSSTITVTTIQRAGAMGRGRGLITASADGSTVPKDGGPYGDRYPYLLAPGEEVISNRYGQADRNRALLKAINAGRLADGGTADKRGRGGVSSAAYFVNDDLGIGREARGVSRSLKSLRAELEKSRTTLAAEKQKRQEMLSYRGEVGGSLASSLTGDGLAGFDAALAANGNDARTALAALKKARSRGLDGPLFDLVAASGDINLITQFANLSRSQIALRERQYGSTLSAQNAFGGLAAGEKFDISLERQARVIDKLEKTIRSMRREIRQGAKEGVADGSRKAKRGRTRETAAATKARR